MHTTTDPSSIHLLIPMSGQGVRYQHAGYSEPKPLIPVSGRPMISRLLNVMPMEWPTTFVIAENHVSTKLPGTLKNLRPKSTVHVVAKHQKGPSWAILEGLTHTPEDAPVLVSYCDYGMSWDPRNFEEFVKNSECDACVISYRGFHAHYLNPLTYAFSRTARNRVIEIKEKGSFTDNREQEFASCGAYYFRTARLLRESINYQIRHEIKLNGEYYTSLTIEALLRSKLNANVRIYEIPYFYQWGTPEDLKAFEYWERSMTSALKYDTFNCHVSQVLMPMAGKGSRFQEISKRPKPFIRMGSGHEAIMMHEAALSTLPSGKTVLVALTESEPFLKNESTLRIDQRVFLSQTPDGQALSVEAGLSSLDLSKEVIVSSCDHGIALNPSVWKKFHENPQCDAAIFVVRNYPGANRKPKSFAYVVPASNDEFPEVTKVSVKTPVSNSPMNDHLLVGTFWFASGHILKEGIEQLKKLDLRVNGELYLDSVFELLQENGKIVRMLSLDGYLCWGDPESMAETLYWQEVFGGHKWDARKRLPGVD